jgi:hypothetical protein
MNHAQWVADLMKADGVKPEQVTTELVMAYFDEVGRKIKSIQSIYLTRNGAKQAMCQAVLSKI